MVFVGSFDSGSLPRLQSLPQGPTRAQSASRLTHVAVSRSQALAATWTAPWGSLQHSSWIPSERARERVRRRKRRASKTKTSLYDLTTMERAHHFRRVFIRGKLLGRPSQVLTRGLTTWRQGSPGDTLGAAYLEYLDLESQNSLTLRCP